MQEFSGPNDSFPLDPDDPNDRPKSKAESGAEDGSSGLEAKLVADLAAGEMRLISVFLAAANTAGKNGHEALHVEYLRKAFVLYCEARLRLLQLPASERGQQLYGVLADELKLLQQQVLDAFSEDNGNAQD